MDCMNKKNPPQVVGMTYVPWQHWGEVYEPCRALKYGTLFPILNADATEAVNGQKAG